MIFSHSSITSYVIQGKKKPIRLSSQRAKKVMSDSPGLVDFATGPVIFVLNLPNGQVLFFWGNSNYIRILINPANQKGFWG